MPVRLYHSFHNDGDSFASVCGTLDVALCSKLFHFVRSLMNIIHQYNVSLEDGSHTNPLSRNFQGFTIRNVFLASN